MRRRGASWAGRRMRPRNDTGVMRRRTAIPLSSRSSSARPGAGTAAEGGPALPVNMLTEAIEQGVPLIVLSPHLDDAVLSCGALLIYAARRTPVTVVTLFTEAGRRRTRCQRGGTCTRSGRATPSRCTASGVRRTAPPWNRWASPGSMSV